MFMIALGLDDGLDIWKLVITIYWMRESNWASHFLLSGLG